eukprot:jgi/Mesvir1/26735/Mv20511-RA.1
MSFASDVVNSLQRLATPKDFFSDLQFAARTNLYTCMIVAAFPLIASWVKTSAKGVDKEYRVKQLKISAVPAVTAAVLAYFDTYMKTGKWNPGSAMGWLNIVVLWAVMYGAWLVAVTV